MKPFAARHAAAVLSGVLLPSLPSCLLEYQSQQRRHTSVLDITFPGDGREQITLVSTREEVNGVFRRRLTAIMSFAERAHSRVVEVGQDARPPMEFDRRPGARGGDLPAAFVFDLCQLERVEIQRTGEDAVPVVLIISSCPREGSAFGRSLFLKGPHGSQHMEF